MHRYAGPETGLGAVNGTNAALVDAAKDMAPKTSDEIKKFWCVLVLLPMSICVSVCGAYSPDQACVMLASFSFFASVQ